MSENLRALSVTGSSSVSAKKPSRNTRNSKSDPSKCGRTILLGNEALKKYICWGTVIRVCWRGDGVVELQLSVGVGEIWVQDGIFPTDMVPAINSEHLRPVAGLRVIASTFIYLFI